MSNLKTYLASKYMSGPKADAILAHAGEKKKKRKRKNEDYVGGSVGGSAGGLMLKDEDEWSGKKDGLEFDGDDAPVVGKEAATFKKGKSAWSTVGGSALPIAVKTEKADSPVKEEPTSPRPQMTKRRGGLRTAKQMAEEAERAAAEARSPTPEPGAPDHTQTVHRDQSGRVLDINELKEKARREELDEKRKAEERKGWTKGLVQQDQQRARAVEEARMSRTDVARHADDARMNAELKEVEHWDDPALKFAGKKKKKGPKYPTYKGAWPENRFAIPPGYRWDGVDRSNGFEKKWIQAQNTVARNTHEANKWSMEDM